MFGVTLRGQIPFGDKVSFVFVENRKTMLKGRRVRVSHSSRSPRGWLVPPPPYFKIQTRICDLSTSNSLPVPVRPPARLSVRLRRLQFIRCQGSPRWMDGWLRRISLRIVEGANAKFVKEWNKMETRFVRSGKSVRSPTRRRGKKAPRPVLLSVFSVSRSTSGCAECLLSIKEHHIRVFVFSN